MEYVSILLTLAIVDFVAVATPGPNFMLVSQTAATTSRSRALLAVGGVLASNLTWCAAVFLGLSAIFDASPRLHSAAQVAGAAYLIYLAIGLWRAPQSPAVVSDTPARARDTSRFGPFMQGWFIGVSNPKSLVYFSSVFTALLPGSSSVALHLAAVAVVAVNTFAWYGIVALVLSHPVAQRKFLSHQRLVNRTAGALLGVFGVRLLLAKYDA
jgi:threonine efflux protein